MPNKIYATPRGSGTISGIYVDMPMGDEPRGEHEYIRADNYEKLLEIVKESLEYADITGTEYSNKAKALLKQIES